MPGKHTKKDKSDEKKIEKNTKKEYGAEKGKKVAWTIINKRKNSK